MPATNSGHAYAFDMTSGANALQNTLASPENLIGKVSDGQNTDVEMTTKAPAVNYLWYIFGIFILLVVFKFASESSKTSINPSFMGVGLWNFFTVGIMATLFIVVEKTILNKYRVTGLTDIVNLT